MPKRRATLGLYRHFFLAVHMPTLSGRGHGTRETFGDRYPNSFFTGFPPSVIGTGRSPSYKYLP